VGAAQRLGVRRWLVAGSIAVILLSVTLPAGWVEAAYSRGIFPWLQSVVVSVTGWVPWPLTFTVLALLPIAWPILGWLRWRRGRRLQIGRLRLLVAGSMRVLRVLLYTGAAFLLMWGAGYRRLPIEERWQLRTREVQDEHVYDVSCRLLAILHRDAPADGVALDEARAYAAIAAQERQIVAELEGWTPLLPAHIKHPPAGVLLAMGVYGVCYPFTLEANVDPALPVPFRVAISGHELAHVLGYCGEADANLVSFVAGLRSDDALARYCTALSMMRYALLGGDVVQQAALRKSLPKRAQDDFVALAKANGVYRITAAARLQSSLNDAYLKSQGVALGTADYERGFRLFVAAFRQGMLTLPAPLRLPAREPRQKAGPAGK
jgi:hypothetical protein